MRAGEARGERRVRWGKRDCAHESGGDVYIKGWRSAAEFTKGAERERRRERGRRERTEPNHLLELD